METFTNSEVQKILRLKISPQTLLKSESEGRIPKALRIKRGHVNVRKWKISDIPTIALKYGKIKRPERQRVISFFTGKGGVLKSTLAFNLGRILALNGIKTILIGLDIQESLTTLSLGQPDCEDIKSIKENKGLYNFFHEQIPLNTIIQSTDIPTLDVIPETFGLNLLDKEFRGRTQRENILKKKLIPSLNKYELIIFDNAPNWNLLIENSLVASNIVIAPISCEIGTYQALKKNLNALVEFKEEMEIEWEDYLMIPTLLENNKISKEILGAYYSEYGTQVTNGVIRRTVKGQESMALKQSIFEYAPLSELASDYDSLFTEIWTRINKATQ